MNIPLVDLAWQHQQVAPQIAAGLEDVFARTAFILGEEVEGFERSFAVFSGIAHCVGVSSGTDALELSLRALDVGPGHEVILPANTFVATALAVLRAGATPVLVDVDDDYLLMDMDRAAAAVTPSTRALIPVHLYGQMAPMGRAKELAGAHGLHIIEDAAQSQGATQADAGPGTGTAAAATSFYPGKNLGAYGDAGAILTESDALAERLRGLRNWGSTEKYHHPDIGFNARLDTVQAVVLSAKLAHLAAWNEARRQAADRYHALLGDIDGVRLPSTAPGNRHVWHLYVVRVPKRDEVLERLHAQGIGAGVHYPIPIHQQKAFTDQGPFPVTERAAAQILSLPMFPGITVEQQERVASALRGAL